MGNQTEWRQKAKHVFAKVKKWQEFSANIYPFTKRRTAINNNKSHCQSLWIWSEFLCHCWKKISFSSLAALWQFIRVYPHLLIVRKKNESGNFDCIKSVGLNICDAGCLAFFLPFSRGKSVNDCRGPFIVGSNWSVCVWTDEIEITAAYFDTKWIELWVLDTHMNRKIVSKPTWSTYESNIFDIFVVIGRRTVLLLSFSDVGKLMIQFHFRFMLCRKYYMSAVCTPNLIRK